jgi:carboxypeptidase Q
VEIQERVDSFSPLQAQLLAQVRKEDLLAAAQRLEQFAYKYPERNRVFGGPAHRDTVNYLYDELIATGYYDVYKEEQVHTWSRFSSNVTVDGKSLETGGMMYSPAGEVSADLALVSHLGCKAVSAGRCEIHQKLQMT